MYKQSKLLLEEFMNVIRSFQQSITSYLPQSPFRVVAAVVGISALWAQIATNFQNSALETPKSSKLSLIKITTVSDPNLSPFQYFSTRYDELRYDMPYDLCANINDEDWASMTQQEKTDLNTFYSEFPCNAISEKFRTGVIKTVQDIAKRMGFSNPEQISIGEIGKMVMNIDFENKIGVEIDVAKVLNGFSSRYSHQTASGAIAHEIAHRILKHHEQRQLFKLMQMGIHVNSLDTVSDFLISRKLKEPPKTEAGKQLMEVYSKIRSKGICSTNFILEEKVLREIADLSRNQEKEADLLTFRDPYLARGMRDYLNTQIETCKEISRLVPSFKEIYARLEKDTEEHPATVERRDYMTEGLCRNHRKENQDICIN